MRTVHCALFQAQRDGRTQSLPGLHGYLDQIGSYRLMEEADAQVLEEKLRALEHYLKEYQERRRLAVRSSPSSRHRMLRSGGYPDDAAKGDPPAKRQKLAEAAKLEDQRYPIVSSPMTALYACDVRYNRQQAPHGPQRGAP